MTKSPIIIGAGMAGLLAANMLRHLNPTILEKQSSLPNNHSAVLRFRTSAVGDVTNIPFRKVQMIKTVLTTGNMIRDAVEYSVKCTGSIRSDRSINVAPHYGVDDRWIAPHNLIEQMAEPFLHKSIAFDIDVNFTHQEDNPIISTMPMPHLMKLLKYEHQPSFNYVEALNFQATIRVDSDAFMTLMVPDLKYPFSRISITGNRLIVECPRYGAFAGDGEEEAMQLIIGVAAKLIGIQPADLEQLSWKRQKFAKIAPIDDRVRKDFMHWATDKHGVYSLGRYATWRPGLLLDDLVQDIRLIERWITTGDRYAVAKHR